MEELVSIGKTAEIMGVSVQTLRYYSSIGLIVPAYVDPESNYRYYSVDQFHLIDRIKYLQKLDVSLNEIRTILEQDNIPFLLQTLKEHKEKCLGEINRLEDLVKDIDWYSSYFTYANDEQLDGRCYSLHSDKRYIFAVKCLEGESRSSFHVRLHKAKSKLKSVPLKRQFSYILDYHEFMNGNLKPSYLGLLLKNAPTMKEREIVSNSFGDGEIIEVPNGNYFCFKARILSNTWDTSFAKLFFAGKPQPSFVLANEYENSLHDYSQCIYEVQIHIPE